MTREATFDDSGSRAPPYDPAAYGDRLGADYDTLYPAAGLETDAMADLIGELARSRPPSSVLEFGIGTGRLAIELDRRGIAVAGIEASARMVSVLRQKAPAASIPVAVGDYISTTIAGSFSVVALVFNNVLDPRGLPAQLALFDNAARHLVPGGFFVVEAFVLGEAARDGTWTVSPRYVGTDHVELQMARYDIETNTLERTLVHLRPGGSEFVSVKDAYASPAELDVMAHVSGMTRVARYANWSRSPFTARSQRHISVYERSAGRATPASSRG